MSSNSNTTFQVAPASYAAAAPRGGAGNFGYDAQYRWVKGKLEYSESSRTWRLRYIPPEDASDNYGGSVVLSDANQLTGFRPGEFVVAQGAIVASGEQQGSFAATYRVDRIQRQ